ncbi:hypothetical protein [Pseudogemmobacter humi]|uniref:Apolipoprotein acyltransferase n=1 Tax=Pseudogemmobacter humi TaxID=2483812 RepID=A0A3P5XA79_9RHOB|nr:hypothetical protein [Pseudogemmobacter humi]VDC31631.1 hypothetical protein XINFAN_03012 [Pseudogemmobacter humi]
MLAIGGFLLGALLGAFRAHQLGGKPADLAQYAAGFGILFGLAGVIATIVLHRLAAG